MMFLVFVFDVLEDLNRLVNGCRVDHDLLEAAVEGAIFLDILPVLVQGRCADALEFSARESRLKHVRCVERPRSPAGTDDRMQFVDEKITSFAFSSSFITAFILSSNWPRYFVPATSAARSSVTTRLSWRTRETFFWTMRLARPSAIAVLPTPGSPMRTGLFFFLRLNTWATRSISFSRPTTGSSFPSMASFVRSRPKLSRTGVFDLSCFFSVGLVSLRRC